VSKEPEPTEYDEYDEIDGSDCWNCGGEGYVSNCFEEFACVDPESGCDLCTRRCEICNPPKRRSTPGAAA